MLVTSGEFPSGLQYLNQIHLQFNNLKPCQLNYIIQRDPHKNIELSRVHNLAQTTRC